MPLAFGCGLFGGNDGTTRFRDDTGGLHPPPGYGGEIGASRQSVAHVSLCDGGPLVPDYRWTTWQWLGLADVADPGKFPA